MLEEINKKNTARQIVEKQLRRAVLTQEEKKERRIILRKNTGLQANENPPVTATENQNPISVLDNPNRYDSI